MDDHDLVEAQQQFQALLADTEPGRVVFLGGAGVSTESGIPDFRSNGGIFSEISGLPPEIMLSRAYAQSHPDDFFDFYFNTMIFEHAEPNQAHHKLAELERLGILDAVITQNVDGLHQMAGSANVLELHGSVHRNHCRQCGASYGLRRMLTLHDQTGKGIPRCEQCGGEVWPDVVLYGDPLDRLVLAKAADAIGYADMLIIAGTSLRVYPAASLVQMFEGRHLVVISLEEDPHSPEIDLYVQAPVGRFMSF